MKPETVWTSERVTQLKSFWADGFSCSEIARKLDCAISRNSVIGKVHRLGLGKRREARYYGPRRASPPRPPKPPRTSTVATVKLKARNAPQIVPLPEPPASARCTILHLSDKTCKWPIGDPGTENFCFCGHEPHAESPYCEFHSRIAYRRPEPKGIGVARNVGGKAASPCRKRLERDGDYV